MPPPERAIPRHVGPSQPSPTSRLSAMPPANPRPLPPGPGPLDERGRRLETKGRGLRGRPQPLPRQLLHQAGPPPGRPLAGGEGRPASRPTLLLLLLLLQILLLKLLLPLRLTPRPPPGSPPDRCTRLRDPWEVQECLRSLPSPEPRRSPSLGRLESRERVPALRRSSSLRGLRPEPGGRDGGGGQLDVLPGTSWALSGSGAPTRGGRDHHSQEEQRKSKRETVISIGNGQIGLRNLGNTCFMNAILQCLSNSRKLRDYCIQKEYLLDVNGSGKVHCELMDAFADLITALWDPASSGSVSPLRFLQTFQRFVPHFMGYRQQDAQEFLRFLMDWLHREINRKSRKAPSIMSVSGIRGFTGSLERMRDDEKSIQMWKQYLERDDSKIVDLFVGQLNSTLRCTSCGYQSSTFEVFCDLSLPIPKKMSVSSRVPLDECLSLFTAEEELDAENAPMCDRCNQKKRSTKKLTIQRLPKILVLHLNRFAFSRYAIRKCTTFVDFPLYGLGLQRCTADKAGNSVYDLYAVCNHTGTVNGGHYTAYCKSAGKWHVYNDSRVSLIQDNQVVSSEGYLLFYELDQGVPSQ